MDVSLVTGESRFTDTPGLFFNVPLFSGSWHIPCGQSDDPLCHHHTNNFLVIFLYQ
ncbi:MAG: hypothetical protein IH594_13645 [Bacteroidales bacterium]|nr:hypothetical protein [Bacteroidales bacterium]